MHAIPYYGHYYPSHGVWPLPNYPAYLKRLNVGQEPHRKHSDKPYDISPIRTSSSSTPCSTCSSSSPLSSSSTPSLRESVKSHIRPSSAHSIRPFQFAWQRRRRVAFLIDQGRRRYGHFDQHPFLCPGDAIWLSSPLPTSFHPNRDNRPRPILKRHIRKCSERNGSTAVQYPHDIYPSTSKTVSIIPRRSWEAEIMKRIEAKNILQKKNSSPEQHFSERCDPLPYSVSSQSKCSSIATSQFSTESDLKHKSKYIKPSKMRLKRPRKKVNIKVVQKEKLLLNKIEKLLQRLSAVNSNEVIEMAGTINDENTLESPPEMSKQDPSKSSPTTAGISSPVPTTRNVPVQTVSYPPVPDPVLLLLNPTCPLHNPSNCLPTTSCLSSLSKPPTVTSPPGPHPTPPPSQASAIETERHAAGSSNKSDDNSSEKQSSSKIQEKIMEDTKATSRAELRKRAVLKIIELLFKLNFTQLSTSGDTPLEDTKVNQEESILKTKSLNVCRNSKKATGSIKVAAQDRKSNKMLLKERGMSDISEKIETLVAKYDASCNKNAPTNPRIFKLRKVPSECSLDSAYYHTSRKMPLNHRNIDTKYIRFDQRTVKFCAGGKKQQNMNEKVSPTYYNTRKLPSHSCKRVYNYPNCSECSDENNFMPCSRGQKLRRSRLHEEDTFGQQQVNGSVCKQTLTPTERYAKGNGYYSSYDTNRNKVSDEQETYPKRPFVTSSPRSKQIYMRRRVPRVFSFQEREKKKKKSNEYLHDRFKPDMWLTSNFSTLRRK